MSDRRFRIIGVLGVVALMLVAASPSLRNGFLNYDDPQMILDNPRLDDPGVQDVIHAFHEIREHAYLPLYTIALMPDAAFFGKDPAGFHLGSLVWHAIAVALALLFVHALTGSRTIALIASAFLAVHPMAAESVAWASGRKDQVSFVLLLIALAAALGHLRHGGLGRIALSAAFGGLAMLAKGSAVVYPLLVLLLCVFTRRDASRGRESRQKALVLVAFVVAGAGAAVHYVIAMREGAASAPGLSPWERVPVFLESLWGYFRNVVCPANLSIHYEMHGSPWPAVAGGGVLALGIGSMLALGRAPRGARLVATCGFAWFVLSLLPFNGIFPATSVAMADRYAFNGLIGFGIAAAALVASLPRVPRIVVVVAALGALIVLARGRYAEFRDGATLFRAALRVDPDDPLAALKLGEALRDGAPTAANRAEAIRLFRHSAERARDPVREARARLLLADALLRGGAYTDATAVGDRLLELEREAGGALKGLGYDADLVRFNRAAALLGSGDRSGALAALDEVLARAPLHAPSRLLRAGLDAQEALLALPSAADPMARDRLRERVNAAIRVHEEVLNGLRDGRAGDADREIQATSDLARLLQSAEWRTDRLNEAMRQVATLIRRHPGRAEGYIVRAQIVSMVDPEAAAADLRAALACDPVTVVSLRAIAGGLLGLGKNRDAVAVLERARSVDPGDPGPANDLLAIYVAAAESHLEGRGGAAPDVAKAREAWKLAAAVDAANPSVIAIEADCLTAEGNHEAAWDAWNRVLAADAAHPRARAGAALARMVARESLERAGHAAMQAGESDRALDAFARVAKLDPDNLAAHAALARLYRVKDDRERALEHARRFLALTSGVKDPGTMLKDEIELMRRIIEDLE